MRPLAPPTQTTLWCLPCAGASATMYLRWQQRLPRWLQLRPVELPGRGSRIAEPAFEDIEALVEQLDSELAARLMGRYALFGHSMGGLLAWRLAQHIRARGASPPVALFVSACVAPSAWDLRRFPVGDDDASLVAELRRQNGTPAEVFEHTELLRMTLDTLRADYRVCRSYAHRAARALPTPIHVFGGRDDRIDAAALEAWSRETTSHFAVDTYDGGHFYLRGHEASLLAAITGDLAHEACSESVIPVVVSDASAASA